MILSSLLVEVMHGIPSNIDLNLGKTRAITTCVTVPNIILMSSGDHKNLVNWRRPGTRCHECAHKAEQTQFELRRIGASRLASTPLNYMIKVYDEYSQIPQTKNHSAAAKRTANTAPCQLLNVFNPALQNLATGGPEALNMPSPSFIFHLSMCKYSTFSAR